jgi:hypothetical protein
MAEAGDGRAKGRLRATASLDSVRCQAVEIAMPEALRFGQRGFAGARMALRQLRLAEHP